MTPEPIAPPRYWPSAYNAGANVEALYRIAGRLVRLRVHTESVPDQRSAVAELWSPSADRWNELARIPGPLVRAESRWNGAQLQYEATFTADLAALLAEARMILDEPAP